MINELSTINVTMSSLEIAELTGKAHRNVMRDIREMLTELEDEGGVLKFEHTHTNQQNGQTYPCFKLPKREAQILITGYSVKLRAAVIDRLNLLEELARNQQPEIRITTVQETAVRLASYLVNELEYPEAAFTVAHPGGTITATTKGRCVKYIGLPKPDKSLPTPIELQIAKSKERKGADTLKTQALIFAGCVDMGVTEFHMFLRAMGIIQGEAKNWYFSPAHMDLGYRKKGQLHWYRDKFEEVFRRIGFDSYKEEGGEDFFR